MVDRVTTLCQDVYGPRRAYLRQSCLQVSGFHALYHPLCARQQVLLARPMISTIPLLVQAFVEESGCKCAGSCPVPPEVMETMGMFVV